MELIDREADLLMRGVKETNLEGLRKRISTLFLQYIKTPTFNPEVAKLLKVHYMARSMWTPVLRTSHSKIMGINMELVPPLINNLHSSRKAFH